MQANRSSSQHAITESENVNIDQSVPFFFPFFFFFYVVLPDGSHQMLRPKVQISKSVKRLRPHRFASIVPSRRLLPRKVQLLKPPPFSSFSSACSVLCWSIRVAAAAGLIVVACSRSNRSEPPWTKRLAKSPLSAWVQLIFSMWWTQSDKMASGTLICMNHAGYRML